MESAWGIEHGEVSKGLPRAVKNGGGGGYGSLLRLKNKAGQQGAKYGKLLPNMRSMGKEQGKQLKEGVKHEQMMGRVNQRGLGNNQGTRGIRAGLLNEDSAARRAGFKTGKSSALDRHYRGRVSSSMKDLP